jgi:hypothetical protein
MLTEAQRQARSMARQFGISGYRGAQLLRRPVDDQVELVAVTFCNSVDHIRQFVGADIDVAKIAWRRGTPFGLRPVRPPFRDCARRGRTRAFTIASLVRCKMNKESNDAISGVGLR